MEHIVSEYVDETTWRTKQNANHNRSFSSLQSHIAGTILAKDALSKFGRLGKRHLDGNYHIHNLEAGLWGRYCNGNDLLTLLQRGLINVGGVAAKPPKHFSTACDQIVNFTYLMTGEFAGAQGWNGLDIYLAPFVHVDGLKYGQTKQMLQQLIWNLSFNLRPGYQSPFVNLSMGLRPSKYYSELTPFVDGTSFSSNTYADFQDETDMINNVLLDIMIEGPGENRPFTFPMPTYNITKDFKWNSDIANKIFELAATWGTPYFANYIGTDMSEEDSLSMCCRLKLDLTQVQKFSGGIWNFGANTGSLAVFTINMSRIGYMSNGNEAKFYRILDSMLDDGKEYLLMKKNYIKQGSDLGLFPMTDTYIGEKLFKTYFLTIGINGLNECSLNFCGENIIENATWCNKVLKYIRDRVLQFQVETGQLFNFEATPGEGCSYSLARIDKEKYPDIITQGDDTAPYYTGSSLIPMDYDINIIDAIRHQDILQQNYTGGTVFHIDLGEMGSPGGIKALIKSTCENTKLPYMTWSPSYSVCPDHGRIGGKIPCCEKGKIITRVVGYYRETDKFNVGKRKEFDNKKFYRN